MSAFANTLGGALIFGMADDGQIVGLTEPDSDAEKISEILKTRMEPIPEFRLRFHKIDDGKVLLILDVFKGEETPYYYSGDGTLEAFVRIGNESVRASATELKRLVLRGRNTSYDSQMTLYRVEDYAFSKLRERYKKWTGNSFDNKDLVSFGLADEGGFLTNAGALIADESPIRWSRLFCTRWNGLDKSGGTMDALDDAEYSGSVLSLIENGEAFIKRNARMMWRKTPNSREELPEYVERSYHEALVNALAHRDYLVYGSEVHIDIYDDRLEIYSPGGMPDGSMIRLTVARYYTPAGRCIQKPYESIEKYNEDLIDRYNKGEMMSEDSIHFPDSLKFKTHKLARTVYGGGGIMPDYFVPIDTTLYTKYHRQLRDKGALMKAHFHFIDAHRKEWLGKYKTFNEFYKRFEVTPDMLAQLVATGKEMGVEYNEEEYQKALPLLRLQMKALIARDLWDMNEYYHVINDANESIRKALELLEQPDFEGLLLKKR